MREMVSHNSKQFQGTRNRRRYDNDYPLCGGIFDMRMKYWSPASGYAVRFHYVEIENLNRPERPPRAES